MLKLLWVRFGREIWKISKLKSTLLCAPTYISLPLGGRKPTIQKCHKPVGAWDLQERWIPRTNHERETLTGRKLAGSDLNSKLSLAEMQRCCSQQKQIVSQHLTLTYSWKKAMAFQVTLNYSFSISPPAPLSNRIC